MLQLMTPWGDLTLQIDKVQIFVIINCRLKLMETLEVFTEQTNDIYISMFLAHLGDKEY